jgi:hypothetical protein
MLGSRREIPSTTQGMLAHSYECAHSPDAFLAGVEPGPPVS